MIHFKFILITALPTILFAAFLTSFVGGARFGLIAPMEAAGAVLAFYMFVGLLIFQACFLCVAWFFVRRPGNGHLQHTLAWLSLFLVLLMGYSIFRDLFMQGFWFIPVGGTVILALFYFLLKGRLRRFDHL